MVPKAIMLNLVSFTKENMQKELLSVLYKSQRYETFSDKIKPFFSKKK